jgi:hypothetical protein
MVTPILSKIFYCLVIAGALDDPATAKPPSAKALVALAPTASSDPDGSKRIKIRASATTRDSGNLSFFALYRSPNQFAMCLIDGENGVPVMYFSQGKLIAFSPIHREAYYISGANLQLTFASRDERPTFRYLVLGPREPSKVLVDLKPAFRCEAKGEGVRVIGENRFRLTQWGRSDDVFASATVDLSRRCPFTQLELNEEGAAPDSLRFELQLEVDDDVTDAMPSFPEISVFKKAMRVIDLSDDYRSGRQFYQDVFVLCLAEHAAARNTKCRSVYEQQTGQAGDWDAIVASDRKMSDEFGTILRSYLPKGTLDVQPKVREWLTRK